MTRFQLVFRRNGEDDSSEYRFSSKSGEPHIDGRLIVDGETYNIRGADWLLRDDAAGDAMARFVCTLVVEPTDVEAGATEMVSTSTQRSAETGLDLMSAEPGWPGPVEEAPPLFLR